ncbi:hypothetical protein SUGI_0210680 [Cryptomeria japonica]|nr:hypothetical protein SUGI_0210680 [Cryptomeria japonica]
MASAGTSTGTTTSTDDGLLIRESDAEYKYAELRDNVNLLKLIQLGFTFSHKNGNLPKCGTNQECVWQFNFREFNSHIYKHNIFSIEMLKKCGIDYQRNEQFGIDSKVFRDLFMSSRVVLNENVLWISFQGRYDFGYLIKWIGQACKQTEGGKGWT